MLSNDFLYKYFYKNLNFILLVMIFVYLIWTFIIELINNIDTKTQVGYI